MRKTTCFIIALSCCFFLRLSTAYSAASQQELKEKETQLKQLNQQIQALQKKLTRVTDKRSLLLKELAQTEKKISQSLIAIEKQQGFIDSNNRQIKTIEAEIAQLEQKIKNQQALLAAHSRARYFMGEYEPLKWLFYPEKRQELSRLSQYYLYIVKARTQSIETLNSSTTALKNKTQALQLKIAEKQQIQKAQRAENSRLENDQRYRQNLMAALDKTIQKNQSALQDYAQDKKKLEQLIYRLTYLSKQKPTKAFGQMKHKLPHPVKVGKDQIQTIHQGLVFFTKEGTTVKAIYPGTVVFSDWLKGYGMLLIIDHGQGYMSLYAHNAVLYKQKGDEILAGEAIANVGHSGGLKQNGLYFEIRYRGKAISAGKWLA